MAVPLVNPDGLPQVNDAGAILMGDDGDPCCCGDGGGGGEPYWIYLKKYCTPDDCNGWIKIWSETAFGDGRTWGEAISQLPCDKSIIKLGGVCYHTFDCQNPDPDGPDCDNFDLMNEWQGPGGTWYPWSQRTALCGVCCGLYCITRVYYSCVDGEYHCFELGREFNSQRRLSGTREARLTQGYAAYILAQEPGFSCVPPGLLDTFNRAERSTDVSYRVRLQQDCLAAYGQCNGDVYDFFQQFWIYYPGIGYPQYCVYQTSNGHVLLCPPGGADVQTPDPNADAWMQIDDVGGYPYDTQWMAAAIDGNGRRVCSGSFHQQDASGSWSDTTWTYYSDNTHSRFTFHQERHEYGSLDGVNSVELLVITHDSECVILFGSIAQCQTGDPGGCNSPGAQRRIRNGPLGRISRSLVLPAAMMIVRPEDLENVELESLL